MTSQLKVDKLQGRTTAGSIVVTSEGTSVETNLQQGLAKVWIDMSGSGTISSRDSLNIASISDGGTGLYTQTFTNGFSNRFYGVGGSSADDEEGTDNHSGTVSTVHRSDTGKSTGFCKIGSGIGGSATRTDAMIYFALFGDLA